MEKENGQEKIIEIDLLHIIKAFWNNSWLIILVVVLCVAIMFGYTALFVSPTYSASAMFYVNNSTVSIGNTAVSLTSSQLQVAQQLVSTYIIILESRETLNEVSIESGVDYTYEELSQMISAAPEDDTEIFRVTVESSSPIEAELIANTIAKVLPDRIADIVEGASVKVVDHAIIPSHRSSPTYSKVVEIGVLFGIVISFGYVTVKEIIFSSQDDSIKSADDISAFFPDIPLLATIPDMRKSGKEGYYHSYYTSNSSDGEGN